ncbi:MAG TPA: copper resistance protein CopC [Stellaceae bacterium]|nr:copper resistance protein CopC [Stellaceae bacterium]
MKTSVRSLLVASAVLCAGASTAFAHAFPDHASPAVGSTVHQPPAEVKIWFTEALEAAFSTISVLDAEGHHMEKGKAKLDPGDQKLLEVDVGTLAPGRYKVDWRVVSVDTHKTQGSFTFTVAP